MNNSNKVDQRVTRFRLGDTSSTKCAEQWRGLVVVDV